ncbi:MAG: phosphatidylserine decarboxylase family protein [Acidobacteriaceae bacterium]|jgi:phosphatidylserine decarboxylase
MVRDGLYYGVSLLVVAVIVYLGTHWISLTAIPFLLAVFFLIFFRDPDREIPAGPGLIVSPGDGKVEEAEWIETTAGARFRVSIFLSVFDVHVNRVPISGKVTLMEYREGQFLNAMSPESAILNEQTLIVIEDGQNSVSFKQIAGLLARRIICDVKTGDVVQRGQRMGMIKFGSRVDVLMPADVELRVKPGDRVQGGKSILGVLPGYGNDKANKSSNGRG